MTDKKKTNPAQVLQATVTTGHSRAFTGVLTGTPGGEGGAVQAGTAGLERIATEPLLRTTNDLARGLPGSYSSGSHLKIGPVSLKKFCQAASPDHHISLSRAQEKATQLLCEHVSQVEMGRGAGGAGGGD